MKYTQLEPGAHSEGSLVQEEENWLGHHQSEFEAGFPSDKLCDFGQE